MDFSRKSLLSAKKVWDLVYPFAIKKKNLHGKLVSDKVPCQSLRRGDVLGRPYFLRASKKPSPIELQEKLYVSSEGSI